MSQNQEHAGFFDTKLAKRAGLLTVFMAASAAIAGFMSWEASNSVKVEQNSALRSGTESQGTYNLSEDIGSYRDTAEAAAVLAVIGASVTIAAGLASASRNIRHDFMPPESPETY